MLKLQKFKKKTDKVNIKNLLISFGIILLGLTILGVYKTFAIYKIDKEYDLIVSKIGDFRGKNQVISYYINNQESDVIPEDKNYEVYVNCENATGTWNESEWELELSNITKYTVTCTVNFKEKYVIENAKSTNNSIIANYSNIENISSNYYLYGTDKNNLNQKSSDITNLNSDTTYYFKKCYEDNNEEICSEVSSLLTAGKVTNFDYTGGEQTYTTTCNGTYKLEVWGAQGGNIVINTNDYIGGYGGYSVGNIIQSEKENLYIYVGSTTNSVSGYNLLIDGGYNGGGSGLSQQFYDNINYKSEVTGGGGATHIAKITGILSSLENYKGKILIVSGGGGGALYYNDLISPSWTYGNGGSGGGYIGNNGAIIDSRHTDILNPTGGTQLNGGTGGSDSYNDSGGYGLSGSFGKGGSHPTDATYNLSSGAGGGFYGGGSGVNTPGAGGSGYIGNSLLSNGIMYCYDCDENDGVENPSYKTISTTGSNADTTNCPDGYSSSPISKCAKVGNGYARITIEECSI